MRRDATTMRSCVTSKRRLRKRVMSGTQNLKLLLRRATIGSRAICRRSSRMTNQCAVFITRLYTGPDGQTYAEEIEAKFTAGDTNDVFNMMGISGAELHRGAAAGLATGILLHVANT